MAMFAQYALAATEEALEDAGWKPTKFEQKEATVRSSWSDIRYLLRSDIDLLRVSVLDQALATLMRSTTLLSHMKRA
jgi:hypothetical protein